MRLMFGKGSIVYLRLTVVIQVVAVLSISCGSTPLTSKETVEPTLPPDLVDMSWLTGEPCNPPCWYGLSVTDILEPPYFLKPSGRPFVLHHISRGDIYVKSGAHNTFIQSIRTNGWYSGIVIIIILCIAVMKNTLVYRRSHIGEIKAVAIATIATGTFGAMTGHYVFGLDAGFWIMTFAGFSYSVFLIYEQPSVLVKARQAKWLHL